MCAYYVYIVCLCTNKSGLKQYISSKIGDRLLYYWVYHMLRLCLDVDVFSGEHLKHSSWGEYFKQNPELLETYLTMTLQFISWVLSLIFVLLLVFLFTELLKLVQRVSSAIKSMFMFSLNSPMLNLRDGDGEREFLFEGVLMRVPLNNMIFGFCIVNHPAIGVSPWLWNPPFLGWWFSKNSRWLTTSNHQTGLWCEVTMHMARRDAMVGPLVDLYG